MMRFLVDADLPRATVDVLQQRSHEAFDVRDIGMGQAKDSEIARYAREKRLCLITGDFGFSDIRNYPPEQYAGIAVLKLPRDAGAKFILDLIDGFLQQKEILARLSGSLAIIEPDRIRVRPR